MSQPTRTGSGLSDLYGPATGPNVSAGFYFRTLWRRKWLVLGVLAMVLAAGAVFTHLQSRVYEATALLIFSQRSQGAFRADVGDRITGNFVSTQIGLITHKAFLEQIARDPDLALARHPMFRDEPDLARALELKLSVGREHKNTDILSIAMEGEDPQRITKIVNKIADLHRARVENNREASTSQAVQEYMKKMADMSSEMTAIEHTIWSRANNARIPGLTFGDQQKDGRVIVDAFQRRQEALLAQRETLRKQLYESITRQAAAESQFELLCESFARDSAPAPASVGATTAEQVPATASQHAALWLEIHRIDSELAKAEAVTTPGGENAYMATLNRQREEAMGRRDAFLADFHRRQYEAQQALVERVEVERRIADLSERLQQIRDYIEAREQALTAEGFAENPDARLSQVRLIALEAQYNAEREKLGSDPRDLSQVLTEAARIERIEQAAAELRGIRVTRRIHQEEYDALQASLAALSEPLTDILNEAAKLERLDQAYVRMESWVREVKLALSQVQVRVYEASEPTVPIRPIWAMNMAFAGIVGLGLSFGLAMLLELSRKTIKTPEDARHSLDMPVLGIVPHFRKLDSGRGVLSLDGLNDVEAAETMSDIRLSIHAASNGAPVRTLLITSATAGEGKSTVAALLAGAFARAGERVLLVDANVRMPYLHAVYKRELVPGLRELLREGAGSESCLRRTDDPLLYLMPAGQPAADGLSHMHPSRFTRLTEALRNLFDRVIIDTTASVGVADVRVMASCVDAVIYIVQSDLRRRALVVRGADALRRSGAKLMGVVINNAAYTRGDHYYFRKRTVSRNGVARMENCERDVCCGETPCAADETERGFEQSLRAWMEGPDRGAKSADRTEEGPSP